VLSTKQNFLFIHVPKTAGNSIQNILQHYSDDEIYCIAAHQDGVERFDVRSSTYKTKKHSTFAEYSHEYGADKIAQLFTFCCIRNPWDRAVSHYFSPHRGEIEWNRNDFIEFVNGNVRPLRYYLENNSGNLRTLSELVGALNFVIRFESLESDFAQVCSMVSIPYSGLPHRNQSNKKKFKKYYDDELIEFIKNKFEEEIELFGYSF
jgi:hypothetical protein